MKQTFNPKFNKENLIEYLSLVFEDDKNSSEKLKPIVELGILKGLEKYESNDRKVNLFVYLTYFVKVEVNKYKSLN